MTTRLELSVVVPMHNEEENVAPLVEAVHAALSERPSWELILVDDGSTDRTPDVALRLAAGMPTVRLLRLTRNFGQTRAMQAGFDHARGAIVVSMDGDLQHDARDIPTLVDHLGDEYDVVVGHRSPRRDPFLTRRLPSWLANWIISWITGVRVRDSGSTLRAYRSEVLDRLHLYADLHRFIPALAVATAGARIAEIRVRHHARQWGASKYGPSRAFAVIGDLLTLTMIRKFRRRPLAMFAIGAVAAAALGLLFGTATVASALAAPAGRSVTMILPGAAMLWLGLAGYLLMLGLLAQVVVFGQPGAHDYATASERPT